MKFFQALWRHKSSLIFLSTPVILLPLPLTVEGNEALCGYCMILMGVYWMTEVIPLAVTSFLPLVLFPALGIMDAENVSKAYFSDTNWLFIGGLIIAVGVETSNLHKRIALRLLTVLGSKPKSLMFGFMTTTFFLSMWISNTATTAMMLPIVEAVTKELTKQDGTESGHQRLGAAKAEKKNFLNRDTTGIIIVKEDDDDDNLEQNLSKSSSKEENARISKALAISVPYAASIGGTATINGTGPNVVLAGQFPRFFPDSTIQLSFATWLIYNLPLTLVFFVSAYLWLSTFYLGFKFRDLIDCVKKKSLTPQEIRTKRILLDEYRKLGSMSWAEATVLIVFVCTALLWFFRNPGFISGWASLFKEGFIDDGTVAMALSSLLFFLPSKKPELLQKKKRNFSSPVKPVLMWKDMQQLFPWNVVFLIGGGFALAEGAMVSGLSEWLGKQLVVLDGIENWLVCLVITILLCLFTELTSNVATASISIPILVALSQSIEVHPIYLLIPPVLATSMAFMLPVATPPNAIAFAYGHLKVIDMVKAGAILNLLGVALVTMFINTYGVAYFGLNEFPDWAKVNKSAKFPHVNITS